jgi:hypothetical protein
MHTRPWLAAFALAALALPGVTPAADRPAPPSREEIAAEAAAVFAQADADHDGLLSPDEFRAFHQLMRVRHEARAFARLDADHDGSVSAQELEDGAPHGKCRGHGGPGGPGGL